MKNRAADVFKKHPNNPVVYPEMVPYAATMTFNAGVNKYQGQYVMLFRDECGFTKEEMEGHRDFGLPCPSGKTLLGLATSKDGLSWEVRSTPVTIPLADNGLYGAYDPRLTVIDGVFYICFAVDTKNGIRAGIARTEDFEHVEVLSLSAPDNRNMVLFPERIGGHYMRLERPFPIYGRQGGKELFDIWSSSSPDMKHWGNHNLVLDATDVPYAHGKVGPGAPPVKTPKGWLTTIHAVELCNEELFSWHGGWHKRYYGGLMLLDLENPSKVIGLCREPVLVPEHEYELRGLRGSVIFPGGMILEETGEVKVYYGAGDTVECLATAHVDDLLKLCEPF